jgi:excinuclease UvrABC ATPase subunit
VEHEVRRHHQFLEKQKEEGIGSHKKWVDDFTVSKTCPECNGARLKKNRCILNWTTRTLPSWRNWISTL